MIIYYTFDCMYPRNIYSVINNYIQENKLTFKEAKKIISNSEKIVENILNEESGWKRAGVTFQKVNSKRGIEMLTPTTIYIHLTTSSDIDTKFCKGLERMKTNNLSCANLQTRNIYLNLDRWFFGSDFDYVHINDYRKYVINHEMGHALFKLYHPDCSEINTGNNFRNLAPVMLQQTYNLCNELLAFNPYPLDDEIKLAIENFNKYYKINL